MPTVSLPDIDELIAAIEKAATKAIGQDIRAVDGFARDQLKSIARLQARLAKMISDGMFEGDPEGQQDHLDILEELITNFVNTLRGLAIIMIEKAWNAVVKVVWDALDNATGVALPRPGAFPSA
jgi:hypothetical protein